MYMQLTLYTALLYHISYKYLYVYIVHKYIKYIHYKMFSDWQVQKTKPSTDSEKQFNS